MVYKTHLVIYYPNLVSTPIVSCPHLSTFYYLQSYNYRLVYKYSRKVNYKIIYKNMEDLITRDMRLNKTNKYDVVFEALSFALFVVVTVVFIKVIFG